MGEEKTCPKCGHKMAKKFAVLALPHRAPDDVMIAAGVRVNPERTLDVVAYHCAKRSFVEFYAADFFMLELDPPSEAK